MQSESQLSFLSILPKFSSHFLSIQFQRSLSTNPSTTSSMSKQTNPTGSQRKKNTQTTRSNVTGQLTNANNASKKSNKNSQSQTTTQQAQQNQNQNQNKPASSNGTASPAPPPTDTVIAKSPQASTQLQPTTQEHVPITGFNAAEVDALLNSSIDIKSESYKPEQVPAQKTAWGQKRMFAYWFILAVILTCHSWNYGHWQGLLSRTSETNCHTTEGRKCK